MRAPDVLIAGVLLFGDGIDSSHAFHVAPSTSTYGPPRSSFSSTWTFRCLETSTSPAGRRALVTRRRRCLYDHDAKASDASVEVGAVKAPAPPPSDVCKDKKLDDLSRSELQALCKKHNLRAVGKTCELLERIRIQRMQEEGKTPVTERFSISSAQRDPRVACAAAAELSLLPSEARESESEATLTGLSSTSDSPDRAISGLSLEQRTRVESLGDLLKEWNEKVNLISRKDISNVMSHHVLPCLAMAEALNLEGGTEVLDVGTGGGLPGLPLAIYYPNVRFTLIDGTGKKISAVQDMTKRLGLRNVRAHHVRAEDVHETFDFVIGRAVTSLPKFASFVDNNLRGNLQPTSDTEQGDSRIKTRAHLARGILYMRGQVSDEELNELGARPTTLIALPSVSGANGDEMDEAEAAERNRGYSSVFHFSSESIWTRIPKGTTNRSTVPQ